MVMESLRLVISELAPNSKLGHLILIFSSLINATLYPLGKSITIEYNYFAFPIESSLGTFYENSHNDWALLGLAAVEVSGLKLQTNMQARSLNLSKLKARPFLPLQ